MVGGVYKVDVGEISALGMGEICNVGIGRPKYPQVVAPGARVGTTYQSTEMYLFFLWGLWRLTGTVLWHCSLGCSLGILVGSLSWGVSRFLSSPLLSFPFLSFPTQLSDPAVDFRWVSDGWE